MPKHLLFLFVLLLSCKHPSEPKKPTPDKKPVEPTTTPTNTTPKAEPALPLRLSDAVAPTRYNVDLTLDPNKPDFSGVVEVVMSLKESTSTLRLHAIDLELDQAVVRSDKGQQQGKWEQRDDSILVTFPEALRAGEATLVLRYHGKMSERDTHGIFRQKENDHWYIMTQFEATDARRAFPCFDEPRFKTPWRLTLYIPKDLTAVTNAPLEEEKETTQYKIAKFAVTKPLPSYLIAFGVGDYDVVDAGSAGKQKTPIRFFVPKGKASEANYPKEVTGQILSLAEDYTGIPYPFEKLDFLVMPESVGFSAMENPGLITFASRVFLAKPEEQSIRYKRRASGVISHEIAHLWFGDLVTPYFWEDVWLNESFASWIGDRVIAAWNPTLPTAQLNVDSRLGVMGTDSLSSARKIRQPILTKDDIENAFDRITYSKGKAVLLMFESWLGEKQFQSIIQAYLKKHSYQNASADDLIAAITEVAGADAGAAFSSFISQEGVPLVTTKLSCEKGKSPTVSLQQERFTPKGSSAAKDRTWGVPVCVRYPTGKATEVECTLLNKPTGELALTKAKSCPAWILNNANATGYYHSRYEASVLQTLLGEKTLSPAEKLGAWGDMRAIVSAGDAPLGDVLGLVPALMKNPGVYFTLRAAETMGGIRRLVPDAQMSSYQKLLKKWFGDKQKSLGFTSGKSEDDETSLLRPSLLLLIGDAANDSSVQKEAAKKAAAWLKDKKAIEPEIVSEVLLLAARGGDKALFDSFVSTIKTTTERRERRLLISAVGSFNDPDITKEALALVLSKELDSKETINIIWAVTDNPKTAPLAYEFVTQNFAALETQLPRELVAGTARVGGVFCDETKKAEVEDFFKDKITKHIGGPRILAQTLEGISLCSTYKAAQTESITAFLAGR